MVLFFKLVLTSLVLTWGYRREIVASMYVSCSASGHYHWTAQVLAAALRAIYPAEVTLSLKLVLKVIFPTQKLRNIVCLPVVCGVLCSGRFQVKGTDI